MPDFPRIFDEAERDRAPAEMEMPPMHAPKCSPWLGRLVVLLLVVLACFVARNNELRSIASELQAASDSLAAENARLRDDLHVGRVAAERANDTFLEKLAELEAVEGELLKAQLRGDHLLSLLETERNRFDVAKVQLAQLLSDREDERALAADRIEEAQTACAAARDGAARAAADCAKLRARVAELQVQLAAARRPIVYQIISHCRCR